MKYILSMMTAFFFVAAQAAPVDDKTKQQVLSELGKIVKETPSLVEESPIPGLYTVLYGTQLFYISKDGRYAFEKVQMIDLKTREDVSDVVVSAARKEIIDKIEVKDMVVFQPEKPKYVVTVFTDIDCPYCQKFHNERQALLDAGIAIRYLMYPRAGVDSAAYKTSEAVFCAKDQPKAMTDAKDIAAHNMKASRSGGTAKPQISSPECEAPIKTHMALLHELGMEVATPQILLSSGQLLRGYVPAKELIKIVADVAEK